ncbi:MAG TPA: autotransporter outer membrane beta-barrel domain-containing protein, partial [Telmatospirillum sp.]|nr:autotransporter outer membrane beta-barrel domain-containing protein [Telmatospirillum sp.]
ASLAALDTLSASGVRSTLDRLSGEPYTGLATTALASGDLFTGLIRRQSLAASSDGPSQGQSASGTGNRVQLASLASDWGYDPVPRIDKPWGMWVSGYGQTGGISSDGNAHRLNETISGGVVGVDYKVNPQLRIGMAFGAGNTSFSLNNDGGRGSVDQTQAALYADYDWGAAYLAGQLGVAYGDGRVRRDVSLPGLPAVATGHATDTQALSSVEAGYRLAMPGHVTLTPFAGLSFDTVRQNGLTESGAGALALTVKGGTTNSAKSQLGTRLDGTVPVAGTALATDLSIGWAREYASGARTATVAFSADPAASFQVDGARSKRDSAVLGAGLALPLSAETSVYLRYDGSLDGSSSSHALSGGFRVTW